MFDRIKKRIHDWHCDFLSEEEMKRFWPGGEENDWRNDITEINESKFYIGIPCSCNASEHTLHIHADDKGETSWLWIRFFMDPNMTFFLRLKCAWKFLWGIVPRHGHFDSFETEDPAKIKRLADMFNKMVQNNLDNGWVTKDGASTREKGIAG